MSSLSCSPDLKKDHDDAIQKSAPILYGQEYDEIVVLTEEEWQNIQPKRPKFQTNTYIRPKPAWYTMGLSRPIHPKELKWEAKHISSPVFDLLIFERLEQEYLQKNQRQLQKIAQKSQSTIQPQPDIRQSSHETTNTKSTMTSTNSSSIFSNLKQTIKKKRGSITSLFSGKDKKRGSSDDSTLHDDATRCSTSTQDLDLGMPVLNPPKTVLEVALRLGLRDGMVDVKSEKTVGADAVGVEFNRGHAIIKTKAQFGDRQMKKKHIEIKCYHVERFQKLREEFGVDDLTAAFDGPLRESGAGKSGSLLLWTEDKKYMAKTLTTIEVDKMKGMMNGSYFDHMLSNKDSLLAKYLGIMRVKVDFKVTYVVIMKNVLADVQGLNNVYDLKGSTQGRYTKQQRHSKKTRAQSSFSVKKDLNFTKEGCKLYFRTAIDEMAFMNQLSSDVDYLCHNNVLDYSLLVGYGVNGTWRAGIIDTLTPYSVKKVAEHYSRGSVHGLDRISCAPPPQYAKRFLSFIQKATFSLT